MDELPWHPVRDALLGLLDRDGEVTATSAARELGGSTGLYSFHLRQLARHGLVEEAPAARGRVRPWRRASSRRAAAGSIAQSARSSGLNCAIGTVEDAGTLEVAGRPEGTLEGAVDGGETLARGLEDESYRRWLELRDSAPPRWRRDEVFSQVVYLTPEEMAGMADVIRALIAQYRHRDAQTAARPAEAAPVAVVARLFPLLEP